MRLGVSAQFIKILLSYLTSRNFQVRVNHIIYSPIPILSGCAQGSLISPTLLNIYVNDIPKANSCHLAIFADDTAILTQHTNPYAAITQLQHYISKLQLWLVNWKIKVNPSKCACLLFTKKPLVPSLPILQIFGQPVPRVYQYKYLGIILDPKLSFNKHISEALTKAKCTSQRLASLVACWSTLPIKHKLLLYKAIIRPAMMYGSQVWGPTSTTNIRKLQFFKISNSCTLSMLHGMSDVKSFMTTSKLIPFRTLSENHLQNFSIKYPKFVTSCCKDLPTILPSPVPGNALELR
ncbi:RNA-directed DNA polymerase from mobile element jockey [Araneus ventricosus]|uniref:RNA-directed DNA polymerase from mobile element jockey n=1 Tax=Araneus ventricosus TaxID=182803 RepID=A0A4Y2RLW3_ARAVE|nr:RNA-directed DNA polymerase from mobile element jockey [Araneus ventricosus]